MNPSRSLSFLVAPLLIATSHAAPPPPPVFQSGVELTGQVVNLTSISNDGKVFSGTFLDEGKAAAFRYSVKDGFQILATDLPEDTEGVWQAGMSDEGKLVYGHLQYDEGGTTYLEGFVWTTTGGFQRVGQIGEADYSVVRAVSGKNKVLAGQYEIDAGQYGSFIWTEREGIRSYASLFPDFPTAGTSPVWISNNLKTAWVSGYDNGFVTMRWVMGKGTQTYVDLPGGSNSLTLQTVTPNGRLGFGSGRTADGLQAVSFLENGTVTPLFPDADFQSAANAVALGGRLVAGIVDANLNPNEFRGTDSFFLDRKTGKLTLLSDLLEAEVPQAAGWTGMTLFGISANADVVIGSGQSPADPNGPARSWMLRGVKKLVTGKPAN